MPTLDLEEDEIFASAPAVPNAVPSPAESAAGFAGGAADKPLHNGLWNRIMSVMYKVQENGKKQKAAVIEAADAPDTSLIYKDLFAGAVGGDATARTPLKGAVLRNDSGLEDNKYILNDATALVRKENALFPLYTDCGEVANTLVIEAQISATVTPYSDRAYPDADMVGICLNCIGANERVEVALLAHGGIRYTVYDTAGVILAEALSQPIDWIRPPHGATWTLRTLLTAADDLIVEIPEIEYSANVSTFNYTTGTAITLRPVSNDHGIICTPQTFSIDNLIISTKD